jgi:hypothetical protein
VTEAVMPTICAYWDGKCQAMMSPECSDVTDQLACWLIDGAVIKILPLEQAKAEFQKGMEY